MHCNVPEKLPGQKPYKRRPSFGTIAQTGGPLHTQMRLFQDTTEGNKALFHFFAPFLTLFRQFVFRFFLNSFVLIPRLVPLFHHFMSSASDVTRDVDDDDLRSRQHFSEKYYRI